jgi:glutathione-regulated potassium-efflux system ancillary protein KefG
MSDKMNILVLFAHPAIHKSRVNQRMAESVKELDGITFHNLYEEYPDFNIDINREQQLLIDHDIIVWHHPFYWYSAPAILKEWIDLVLQHGFAYGSKGKMLAGKKVMTAISTGGRREAYQPGNFNQYTIRQFLSPFEQTARLCNMTYLPPFVVHGSHMLEEPGIIIQAALYRDTIIALRDNVFNDDELANYEYMNDLVVKLENKMH